MYRGVNWEDNLHPAGLYAFQEAIHSLNDAIAQGIESAQKSRPNPFSESLWLELFEKTVEIHNLTDSMPNMNRVLSQYLTPHNEYVKAAYAVFTKFNSIQPNSPPHFHAAKMCAIKAFALILVHLLRKDGIKSSVEYGDSEKNFEGLLIGVDHPKDAVLLTRQTNRSLLSLIDDQDPCVSIFDGDNTKDISCSLVRADHAGWHKNKKPWYGKYPAWGALWQALVNASSKLPFSVPTFWKGSHLGQYNEEYYVCEFWDFFHKRASKEDFLKLHEEILSKALIELQCTPDALHRLQNPTVTVKNTENHTEDTTVYCFLCITPLSKDELMKFSYNFDCYHMFCETCGKLDAAKCHVCGKAKHPTK